MIHCRDENLLNEKLLPFLFDKRMRKIELLAPAGDLQIGIVAIEHGADAVYIGAPHFSARAAAGNTVTDIEKLVCFAHRFHARVYVALNTLLNEEELAPALELVSNLYDVGVDALIIQDTGLLECDLPPIALHASTQMDNRSLEKVSFLQSVGFQQVVLARELNLQEISEICSQTSVPVECFIHGSLCVSYSGQCYISEVMAGRSANRGRCAQFCRHRFALSNNDGKALGSEGYFLSLKDLDLSKNLQGLIDAGVSSLKIEGRLKDINYVKNVTAFYRSQLDDIIKADQGLQRASSGRCSFMFQPDPERTFHRGKTDYFLNRSKSRPAELSTPKAIGQKIGKVKAVSPHNFTLSTDKVLVNGDGLCFFDKKKRLHGFRANKVEGTIVYPREKIPISKGDVVYRNKDIVFTKELEKSEGCRRIILNVIVSETAEGIQVEIRDEDGIISFFRNSLAWETARQEGRVLELMQRQMMKTGNTIFEIDNLEIDIDPKRHISVAELNSLRRKGLEHHERERLNHFQPPAGLQKKNSVPWLFEEVSWRDNVTNSMAEKFYRRHGVTSFPSKKERLEAMSKGLMTTKYCLRRQLGMCPREDNKEVEATLFLLSDNTGTYEVHFHCRACEMVIKRHVAVKKL